MPLAPGALLIPIRVVRDVEVEPQQTLLKTDEKELKVMRVAFSGDGSWMATVSARTSLCCCSCSSTCLSGCTTVRGACL
jgi:hypothetical protein